MKRFNPIPTGQIKEIGCFSSIFIIILFLFMMLTSCSVSNHFSCKEDITITCFYSGQLVNISQATKKCSLVKTTHTEFLVWGHPEIEPNTNCYIKFEEQRIPGTMSTYWIPYFTPSGTIERYKVNSSCMSESLIENVMYSHLTAIKF